MCLFFPATMLADAGTPPPPAFDPATLSAHAWWDPSDLSTLWQDSARTTPVTADGDPVGCIDDKSGNGRSLVQATSGKRPLYKTAGGLHWLELDGTDDQRTSASAWSTVITPSTYEACVAGRFNAITTNNTNFYGNVSLFADPSGYIGIAIGRNTAGGLIGAGNWDGSNDFLTTAYAAGDDFVWSQRHVSGTLYGALDGGADVSLASGNQSNVTTAIRLGQSVSGGYLNGRFYGGLIRKTEFATERADVKGWLAAKAGVTL